MVNSLRDLTCSADQVLDKWTSLIKRPYDLQNKEVDRFHAALSKNNYKEET